MKNQELHPRTAVVNRTQKHKSKQSRLDALLWLAKRFPQAFDNTTSIQPLKIGIMDDILAYAEEAQAAGISKSKLREAVVLYTRRIDYLTCLKAREMRIDLTGNHVAPVTEEEALRACGKIKKRVEKSAKNARKLLQPKPISMSPASYVSKSTTPVTHAFTDNNNGYYADRPTYGVRTTQPKAPAIIMKNKSKNYDPDAVARLKEKLGLSRNVSEQKEPA